jgi:protocatechuate 3,4-dioxygenase, alpha subunit
MSTHNIIAGSQTIGPFWHNGLKWAQGNRAVFAAGNEAITLFGKMYDGDGQLMTDAMIEVYGGDKTGAFTGEIASDGRNVGFARSPTDKEGIYRFHISAPPPGGFLHVMVFARGLLTHVYTRVYFVESESEIVGDAAFDAAQAAGRANTLIAKRIDKTAFIWDIRLQGDGETVFFSRD